MIIRRGDGDYNKIYRPCTISELIGNETIKNMIASGLSKGTLPHTLLFTGPSGCGKTTVARIIALGLVCENGPTPDPCCKCQYCKSVLSNNSMAVVELDSARSGNIDTIRSVLTDLPSSSLTGERNKVLIVDEAHNLTGQQAKSEQALLKFLEDNPKICYTILCTNEPHTLKEVTRNRCKIIQFGKLARKEIYDLLVSVCEFEGLDFNTEILNMIVEESMGVPRKALSFLQLIGTEASWTKKSAEIIMNAGVDVEEVKIWDFCETVLKGEFKNAVKHYEILKRDNVAVESIRYAFIGFLYYRMKRSNKLPYAALLSESIDIIEVPIYGNKAEPILMNRVFKITNLFRSYDAR